MVVFPFFFFRIDLWDLINYASSVSGKGRVTAMQELARPLAVNTYTYAPSPINVNIDDINTLSSGLVNAEQLD